MKNPRIFLLLVSLALCNIMFSQQSIVFEKTYRTVTPDTVIMSLTGAQTSDGGYLLGGYVAYGMYLSQMMFFKIDSVGNFQWKRFYGTMPCSSNMIQDMKPVGDGTFICCGEGTFSTEGEPGDLKPTNSMIMRVDEEANILWHKEFDTGYLEDLVEIALSDTSYICVGYKQDITKYSQHYLWITGDIAGNHTNVKTHNFDIGNQSFSGVSRMPDGGFVAGGRVGNQSNIFVFSENGDTLKTKILGSGFPDQITISDIKVVGSEIIYGGMYIESMPTDSANAFIAQSDLNLINQSFYVYPNENAYKVIGLKTILPDYYHNNFVALGELQTYNRSGEIWLRKYDSDLNLLWKRYLGGVEGETLRDAINTSDGGYLIIGDSNSFDQYTSMYIVKIDSLGLGNYTSPVEEFELVETDFTVYPNPADSYFVIENASGFKNSEIILFDITGKIVFQSQTKETQSKINTAQLPSGIYIVKQISNGKVSTSKIIINH